MVLNVKNYFSKMHLSIQYSLQLKQTKLLYELLKDYENIKTKTIDYDLVLGLLNSNSERNKKFAYFNNDILKKAINEINDKSDIRVTYEPIKERLDGGRANVTKVKFNITKQPESRLIELGLLQQTITSNKFYSKSKNKLDKLVKNGYKVIDEEMWIETDINKNEERYDAEMRIDEWLKNTHKDVRNEIYELLAKTMDDCDEQFIYIDGYLIRGVFSNDAYTKNPMETIELMNNLLSSIDYESDD
jgi:plasmid replication initiation protein